MQSNAINSLNSAISQEQSKLFVDKKLFQSLEEESSDIKLLDIDKRNIRKSKTGMRKMKKEEQAQRNFLEFNKLSSSNISEKAMSIILKYSNNPFNISPLMYAIQIQDLDSAEILIREQLLLNLSERIELPSTLGTKIYNLPPVLALLRYVELNISQESNDTIAKYLDLIALCVEGLNLKSSYNLCEYKDGRPIAENSTPQGKYLLMRMLGRYGLMWPLKETSNLLEKCFSIAEKLLIKGEGVDSIYGKSLIEFPLQFCDYSMINLLISFGVKVNNLECLSSLGFSMNSFKTYRENDYSKIDEILKKTVLLLKNNGLDFNLPSRINPSISQLDQLIKSVLELEVNSDIKKDMITFLYSLK